MGVAIPEMDWKYLRSIQSGMLSTFCEKVNRKALEILRSGEMSELDKYKALYKHIRDSDDIIAQCFDDWRRSNILLKAMALRRNGLLTEEHLRHLPLCDSEVVRVSELDCLDLNNLYLADRTSPECKRPSEFFLWMLFATIWNSNNCVIREKDTFNSGPEGIYLG